ESVDLLEQVARQVDDEPRAAPDVEQLPARRPPAQVSEDVANLCLVLRPEVRFVPVHLDQPRMHLDVRPNHFTVHPTSSLANGKRYGNRRGRSAGTAARGALRFPSRMSTDRLNRAPALLARIVAERLWGDSDFFLIDVGASGGIDRHWSVFGDRLKAIGFEPLLDEAERLRQASAGSKISYEAALVSCHGFD